MAKNTETWGRDTARERYSAPSQQKMRPASEQAPQNTEDKHGSKYDNDASGWVRGMPNAEAKPGFDKKGSK